MTGPEHYRTAEVLLANLRDEMAGHPGKLLRVPEQQAQMIAEAQVHATLALAAATWDVGSSVAQDEPLHRDEWSAVTS